MSTAGGRDGLVHPVLAGPRVRLRPGDADPAAANHRAIRCYEKVGFRRVGVLRQYERGPDGRFHDGLLMDLLRPELSGEAQ